jgi:4'-phosphopantetheinyl transferase
LPGYHLLCKDINLTPEPRSPQLSEGAIHVWIIEINSQLPVLHKLQQLLSSDEKAHAARFHQDKDAQQFIITRAILRILLADTLAVQPEDIHITTLGNKKPILAKNDKEVHFNVSHSGDRAIVAIANQAVGVDIEFLQAGFEYHSVAEYAFSDMEAASLRLSNDPVQEFFRLWTRKEAFLKGLGTGLINDLQLISCIDGNNEIPSVIEESTADWEVRTLMLSSTYTVSIAFERFSAAHQIFLFDFSHAAL